MSGIKAPHHKGSHQRRAKQITTAAYANPLHRCWRCRRTLAEVQAAYPRRRVHWTAGHLIDGLPGGPMAAECSPCNYGHGAALGNRRRTRQTTRRLLTSENW